MSKFVGETGIHDVGGETNNSKICLIDPPNTFHEKSIHALLIILASKSEPLMTTDELRRSVESLEPDTYKEWSYYDKWAIAQCKILIERGVIQNSEIDYELGNLEKDNNSNIKSYNIGDEVYVKKEDSRLRWRKPHLRTPGYIFGQMVFICNIIISIY
jgi:hypothetical protein